MTDIRIQTDDFDQGEEYRQLASGQETGAVVTFVGRVREFSSDDAALSLEHYPGMTEKVLKNIVAQAQERWETHHTRIVHRIGNLQPGEQIVFVGVSAAHRHAAFAACEFIMDLLKTEAPFWKKEGGRWVEAKESDARAAEAWHHD